MIDRQRLIEMMDGDAEIADKFISEFKRISKEQIPLIQKYVVEKNWPMLANSAHVMKTQAGYMGLEEVEKLSIEVESLTSEYRSGFQLDPDGIIALVEELIGKVSTVLDS